MAIPDRDTRKGASAEDRENLPPRDRDQHAVSAARAQDKADAAEVSANRAIAADGLTSGETLPARDRMQGAPATAAANRATGSSASSDEGADDRRRRVAEHAYYKAERRGFAPGGDQSDWFEAENEIDRSGGESRGK